MLGLGEELAVAVGVAVVVGVAVAVAVTVAVAVAVGVEEGVGVGVGPPAAAQYLPPLFNALPETLSPPQTIICCSLSAHTAV